MTTVTVYDPAMCCATGVCGAEVDQRLVDLAADLDWLAGKGVTVRRIGLSREPAEFAANPVVRELMQASGGDDLPAILVDGALVSKARYPSRAELAAWTGVATPTAGLGDQARELVALGAAVGAGCEPCLDHHVRKGREVGLTDAQIRAAVAMAMKVREAAGENVRALAARLVPAAACCGPAAPAPAGDCCGGAATSPAPAAQKGGACC